MVSAARPHGGYRMKSERSEIASRIELPSAAGPTLEATVVRGRAALESLAAEWQALEAGARVRCVFHSVAWARHAQLLGPRIESDAGSGIPAEDDFLAVTCRRGKRLVGLWPLTLAKRRGLSLLISVGAPFNQFSEPLIARTETAWPVLERMTMALKRARLADGMLLRKVRLTGDLPVLKRAGAGLIDHGTEAPVVRFDTDKPFTDYLDTVNAKTRKNLRNAENRLRRSGDLEHTVIEGDDLAELVRDAFERRRMWLDEQGLSSEAFRDGRFRQFVAALSGDSGRELGAIGFALRLSGRPIALQWGFVHAGTYSAYLSARDPELEAFSVGRLHLRYVLEACHQRGIGEVDLMVPKVPYKMSWTAETVPVADFIWAWTPRGFLALGLVEQAVRPGAKRLAAGLPVTMRRRLMALANK